MLEPPYNYLHVHTSFYVNPSFGGLSSQDHHSLDGKPYMDALFHLSWKGKYLKHVRQPHATMMWHGQ
jgi:hypothetical protein